MKHEKEDKLSLHVLFLRLTETTVPYSSSTLYIVTWVLLHHPLSVIPSFFSTLSSVPSTVTVARAALETRVCERWLPAAAEDYLETTNYDIYHPSSLRPFDDIAQRITIQFSEDWALGILPASCSTHILPHHGKKPL